MAIKSKFVRAFAISQKIGGDRTVTPDRHDPAAGAGFAAICWHVDLNQRG